MRFRQDVHINNGGDGPEVLGHADADVWPFAVDVVVAQCNHCFLPACYSVGAKVSIVDLFCEEIRGDRKTESVSIGYSGFISVNVQKTGFPVLKLKYFQRYEKSKSNKLTT